VIILMDKNPGAHIPSSALIENGAAASWAKTESERHASLTGSVFSTPTAAPSADQPTTLFAPLVHHSLSLPAPYPRAHGFCTTIKIPPEPALD